MLCSWCGRFTESQRYGICEDTEVLIYMGAAQMDDISFFRRTFAVIPFAVSATKVCSSPARSRSESKILNSRFESIV